MKRRMMLMVPLLGWAARALGQDPAPTRRPRTTPWGRTVSADGGGDEEAPKKKPGARAKAEKKGQAPDDAGPDAEESEPVPGNFPNEPGFEWQKFDIASYTALPHKANVPPQTAILDWIFRRTETGPWHGEKIAVLCASKTQLRAYNSRKVLDQVAETVRQFTDAQADILTVRVRFLDAAGTNWRYAKYSTLTPVGTGPQGQQIWQTSDANAEALIAQMQLWRGFQALDDQKFRLINGQTLRIAREVDKPYPASAQRSGPVGMGVQPKVDTLVEGIVLRFSPLLNHEGDTLDAAIELSTNLVRRFHTAKVLGPREVGSGEVTLDVPEVSETRLNQAVKTWPLGQTLVISAGIQPGLLLDKRGFLNTGLPGTTPTTTEVLAVITVAIAGERTADAG